MSFLANNLRKSISIVGFCEYQYVVSVDSFMRVSVCFSEIFKRITKTMKVNKGHLSFMQIDFD